MPTRISFWEGRARSLAEKEQSAEMAAAVEEAKKKSEQAYHHARDVLARLRQYELMTTSTGLVVPADASEQQKAVAGYQNLIRQQMEVQRLLSEELQGKNRREVVATLNEQLEYWRAEIKAQKDLILKQYPHLAERLERKFNRLDTFATTLADDEALIEPVLVPNRLFVFVARHRNGKVAVWSSPPSQVNESALGDELLQLWQAASEPQSAFDAGASDDPRSPAHLAANLYDQLFAPIEPALDGARTLLISATGRMRFVPFHVLLKRAPDGRRTYLNDDYNIVYLTESGEIAGYAPGIKYRGAAVVAVADPTEDLETARQEVTRIEKTWQSATPGALFLVKSSPDATSEAVRELLLAMVEKKGGKTVRILHVAAHSQAGASEKDTFLLLADGPLGPEKLHTQFDLLGFSMAVLSGCETARRSFDDRAPGVTGLAYEFEKAHVKTVLGTLWLLDSATGPAFMEEFYQQLATGSTVAAALQDARKKIRAAKPHLLGPLRPHRPVALGARLRRLRNRSLPRSRFSHAYGQTFYSLLPANACRSVSR